MALSGLREIVILTEITFTTGDTNRCVKGDIWCQRSFCAPCCRTILTSVVGVMQAIWQKGDMDPLWGVTEMVLLEIDTFKYRFFILLGPTCSWRNLNPRPTALCPIHSAFYLGMWMKHLSSNRQNTANSSYNTLIPLTHIYNVLWRCSAVVDPSLSRTP